MTTAEFLLALGRANLALAGAVVLVTALRLPVRRWLGARAAYRLWLLPLLAALAVLAPARIVTVQAPPLRGAEALAALAEPPAATVTTAPSVPSSPAAPSPRDRWPLLLALWLAGAVAFGGYQALGQRRFLRLARQGLAGPAVVGVVAPRIVLPGDFEARFSAAERTAVMAHENEHLRAQHSRANALVALLRAGCWFNPLAHLGAHLMRVDQELACDAAVIEGRPQMRRLYAETLLKTQLAVTPLPLGCYWPARSEHPLTMRVAMLTRARAGRGRRIAGAVLVTLLTAGGGLGAWAAQPAQVRYRAPVPAPLPLASGDLKPTANVSPPSPDPRHDPWKAVDRRAFTGVVANDQRIMQMSGTFRSPTGETRRAGFLVVGSTGAWRTMIGERAVLVRFVDEGARLKVSTIVGGPDGRVTETAPIRVASGSAARLTLPEGASLSFTASARDPQGGRDETLLHAAAGAKAAARARAAERQVFPGPAPSEKTTALEVGNWLEAARLGASAAEVLRALQAKAQYRDLEPEEAVVAIGADNTVEALALKPLPPLDGPGADTRTAALGGTGFEFSHRYAVILYPAYVGRSMSQSGR